MAVEASLSIIETRAAPAAGKKSKREEDTRRSCCCCAVSRRGKFHHSSLPRRAAARTPTRKREKTRGISEMAHPAMQQRLSLRAPGKKSVSRYSLSLSSSFSLSSSLAGVPRNQGSHSPARFGFRTRGFSLHAKTPTSRSHTRGPPQLCFSASASLALNFFLRLSLSVCPRNFCLRGLS